MRLMEKRLILDFKELHVVGIECIDCKTQTLIDIRAKASFPVVCPACNRPFYHNMLESPLQKLVVALRSMADFELKVTAHILGSPFVL